MTMARILVLGSERWNSPRRTAQILAKVEEKYKGPYTLVYATDRAGAVRYAAARAARVGWKLEPYTIGSDCGPECPPPEGHRRTGGPNGTYCTNSGYRSTAHQITQQIDLVLSLNTPGRGSQRTGTKPAKQRGIAVWEFDLDLTATAAQADDEEDDDTQVAAA